MPCALIHMTLQNDLEHAAFEADNCKTGVVQCAEVQPGVYVVVKRIAEGKSFWGNV